MLGTRKLLETILLHLPAHDITFAEDLCKEWRVAIQESSKVSKPRFRKARPGETVRLK